MGQADIKAPVTESQEQTMSIYYVKAVGWKTGIASRPV